MVIKRYTAHVIKGAFFPCDTIRFSWSCPDGQEVSVYLLNEENYEKQAEDYNPTVLYLGKASSGALSYSVSELDTYYVEVVFTSFLVSEINVEITCNQNFKFEGIMVITLF